MFNQTLPQFVLSARTTSLTPILRHGMLCCGWRPSGRTASRRLGLAQGAPVKAGASAGPSPVARGWLWEVCP